MKSVRSFEQISEGRAADAFLITRRRKNERAGGNHAQLFHIPEPLRRMERALDSANSSPCQQRVIRGELPLQYRPHMSDIDGTYVDVNFVLRKRRFFENIGILVRMGICAAFADQQGHVEFLCSITPMGERPVIATTPCVEGYRSDILMGCRIPQRRFDEIDGSCVRIVPEKHLCPQPLRCEIRSQLLNEVGVFLPGHADANPEIGFVEGEEFRLNAGRFFEVDKIVSDRFDDTSHLLRIERVSVYSVLIPEIEFADNGPCRRIPGTDDDRNVPPRELARHFHRSADVRIEFAGSCRIQWIHAFDQMPASPR